MDVPGDIATAMLLGGEMGDRIEAFDWETHPLGPIANWSGAARTLTAAALASRFPIVLWLGRELRLVYNDAYISALGNKHPDALGEPGSQVWWEIWDVIGPMLQGVVETGVATWSHDQLLMVVRAGYLEEAYFTFTYSPIVEDDGSVGGVFCAVTETTDRVIGTRRLGALRTLASALSESHATPEVAAVTVDACEGFRADVPFLALYLADGDGGTEPLRGATVNVRDLFDEVASSSAAWEDDAREASQRVLRDLPTRVPGLGDRFDVAPQEAAVFRLFDGAGGRLGSLVIGLNPCRLFDDEYRSFCELLVGQVEAGFASAHAYEAEWLRAEALAELDRAKTTFFSNVSHEFRTPLTLMLGPLEEALRERDAPWEQQAERIATARGNGLRLLKLVNGLLDFSRVEGGRAQVALTPTDLSALTENLVSVFRSAFAIAGLDLQEDIAVIDEPVAVDAEMWETVVFNLLSNALKYTHTGTVWLALEKNDEVVTLTVADTGVGIEESELEHIFERFYRSKNLSGRSMEGTGIGLALVRQLIGLHGGDVSVESSLGHGSTFRVVLPVPRRVSTVAVANAQPGLSIRAESFLQETQRWLPDRDDASTPTQLADGQDATLTQASVLVVDDNADMRRYLRTLLADLGDVRAAANGQEALELARLHRPDVVVSDVMMPILDGFGLVAAMRADERLHRVPMLLLSARAGSEASLDGLEHGADDYLVKPFSARELVVRVRALLDRSRRQSRLTQREADQRRAQQAIVAVASGLNGANDFQSVVDVVASGLARFGGFAAASVSVLDRDDATAHQYFSRPFPPELRARYLRTRLDADIPHARAMRDEQLVLFSSRDEYMRATFIGAEDANRLGVEALAAVPLFTASGDVVGCLNIGWSQPVDFNADHLDTLDEFGRIVSRAVERVRVADLERDVARTLQLGLLANEARSTAAVVRCRYLAADATMAIGGDWYDVIELPDGRLVIAVGDVVGQGLAAATTMGQLRAALGMCVLTTSDPAEAITMLDRFAEHVPGASCATVALTVIDPAREVLTHFRAGHPPPLVVPPGGAPQYLEGGHSWPLQVGVSDPRGETGVAPFPAGSLLVLYTDGLIERRHEDLSVGLDRLAGVVARGAAWPLAELERTVVDELVAQPASDDIAILTVRTVAARPNFLATAIKSKPAELWRARHRIDHWLRNHDVPDDARDGFALAIGEALTNAIEHGNGGDERNIAQVELAIMNDEMVATIRDAGRWQTGAEGFLSGRGRGHMLMHAMVDSLEVDNDHQGTVVTLRSRTADREPAA